MQAALLEPSALPVSVCFCAELTHARGAWLSVSMHCQAAVQLAQAQEALFWHHDAK